MSQTETTTPFSKYYVTVKKLWDKPTVKRFSKATATLGLVAFFLLVALKPTIETIFTLNKKIQDLREVETKLTTKIANINQAQIVYQQVQADLPYIKEYYPDNPETGGIVNIISQNSKLSNMNDVTFSISPYQFKNGKGFYSLSYSALNNYINTLNFMKNLSDARRIINLSGLSLSLSKDQRNLNVTVNSDIYYEK